ncbi:hypothetical protein WJX79_003122 [Trebouxia sp. C0005]
MADQVDWLPVLQKVFKDYGTQLRRSKVKKFAAKVARQQGRTEDKKELQSQFKAFLKSDMGRSSVVEKDDVLSLGLSEAAGPSQPRLSLFDLAEAAASLSKKQPTRTQPTRPSAKPKSQDNPLTVTKGPRSIRKRKTSTSPDEAASMSPASTAEPAVKPKKRKRKLNADDSSQPAPAAKLPEQDPSEPEASHIQQESDKPAAQLPAAKAKKQKHRYSKQLPSDANMQAVESPAGTVVAADGPAAEAAVAIQRVQEPIEAVAEEATTEPKQMKDKKKKKKRRRIEDVATGSQPDLAENPAVPAAAVIQDQPELVVTEEPSVQPDREELANKLKKKKKKKKKKQHSDAANQARTDVKKGKFTKQEKDTLKQAAHKYAQDNGLPSDDFAWLLNKPRTSGNRKDVAGAWQTIAQSLPHRTYKSVYACGSRMLSELNYQGKWSKEEDERLRQLVGEKGSKWKEISTSLGRFPEGCRDRWRELKLGGSRQSGRWSEEETTKLRSLVNEYLARKQEIEEKTRAGDALTLTLDDLESSPADTDSKPTDGRIILDDIDWDVISAQHGTRAAPQCLTKWYTQLAPSMVSKGEWGSGDDRRLLRALAKTGVTHDFQVNWGQLVASRSAMQARRRWRLMLKCVKDATDREFHENLHTLLETFTPDLLVTAAGSAAAHDPEAVDDLS